MIRTVGPLLLLLCACVYPTSEVRSGAAPAALVFPEAERGLRVFVDGLDRGDVADFDGNNAALSVTPGRHLVELRRGDEIVYRREVFVAAGGRTDVR